MKAPILLSMPSVDIHLHKFQLLSKSLPSGSTTCHTDSIGEWILHQDLTYFYPTPPGIPVARAKAKFHLVMAITTPSGTLII